MFRGLSTMWKKLLSLKILILLGVLTLIPIKASAASLTLYTPYTGLSVTPGETITYNVDVINDSNTIQHVTFDVNELPKGWDYSLRADGITIEQLSIRANSEEQITVEVNVPLEVNKGKYQPELNVSGNDGTKSSLPLLINVSEKGTFKTDFSIEQPNMQGDIDSDFSYTATLKNQTADSQHYALSAKFLEGWNVDFNVDGSNVTSVTIDPNESKDITINVTPAENSKADTYIIPVYASAGSTTAEIELETVITGKFNIELTTPEGNLSTNITAGRDKNVSLVVENTGSVDLTDISLSAQTPPNWEVTFDQEQIPVLKAGDKTTVKATVEAPDDAIAGDYVTTFNAETPQVSAEAPFRMSVKTSTLWGFVGVAIILIVIGGLYIIFKKYGRR